MERLGHSPEPTETGSLDNSPPRNAAALATPAAPFSELSDIIPYPALIFDRNGRLSHVNSELRSLCGLAPAPEAPLLETLMPPEDARALERAFGKHTDEAESFALELRLVAAGKEPRWHQLRIRALMQRERLPAWLRHDAESAFIAMAYDVHDVKMRERRIEATGCVRNNFLTVASHELRTPLTSLQLNLQMATQRLHTQRAQEGASDHLAIVLKRSLREIRRLEEVVGDILDASRIRAGKLQLRLGEVCLRQLVEEMVHVFERPFAECNCQVRLDIDEGIVGVWDRERLSQVFFNLLANVQKHAPGSGIRIVARKRNERVRVTLSDNGPGIAQQFHKSIFRRFERATEVRGVSGLGLGLYLCRQIVAEHGGHMRVVSEQGRGTRFVIVLPRAPYCRVPKREVADDSERRSEGLPS